MKKSWIVLSLITCIPISIHCTGIQYDIKGADNNLPGFSYFQDKCISLVDSCVIALDGQRLYVSKNLGQTWSEGPKVPNKEIVRMAYVFQTGTLFFCTDKGCYYSQDYDDIIPSSILDVDGTSFDQEAAYHTFSAYEHDGFRTIVDGKEILCWGGYNNEEYINPGFVPRIWMTSDNGKTVKCTIRLGEEDSIKARHVHAVNFNKKDKSFWAQTGDFDGQCHWLQGFYDVYKDIIDWTLIGSGIDYKTGNMQFYEDWIYASKDSYPGGIFRVKYEDARNLHEKKELLFTTPNDCLSIYIGNKGEAVIIMTTTNSTIDPRNFYYSADVKEFISIEGPIPDFLLKYGYSIYYNTWGITEDGFMLSGIRTRERVGLSEWNFTPSVWLSSVLKEHGINLASQ